VKIHSEDSLEQKITLSLVVPVYNEAEAIPIFLSRIREVFTNQSSVLLELIFVNDGSVDATLDVLLSNQGSDRRIKVIDLSRNFGKEAALTAGLYAATGEVVVPIDADLQDPPELIPTMIMKWQEGYEVVLARRISRETDSLAKRISANLFYRVHNRIAKPKLPENVGDFRLLDRCVVDALRQFPESHRFMKGLFAWVGFRTTSVDYSRSERVAGNSKFSGWKLWNFAMEGITSFSSYPLRVWSYLGFTVSMFSIIYAGLITLRVILFGADLPGYASIIVAVTFLGGLQLIGIGVIGEYLGRTYIESKGRPTFIVRRIYKYE
jgi:glycosyltransferase involved in cell wall biosynthesis